METIRVVQHEAGIFDPSADFETKHLDAMRWLWATASGMVDQPARVSVDVTCSDAESAFVLNVAPEDLGKIVGKAGRHARSLRDLFYGMGRRMQCRFQLDIRPRAGALPAMTMRRTQLGTISLDDTVGECVYCQCTYLKPCLLASGTTCSWANAEHTLCTNPECLEKHAHIETRLLGTEAKA